MSGREKRSKHRHRGKTNTKTTVRGNIIESIKNYVNDVSCLKNDIKQLGFPLMGRFDFVSLSEDNQLCILISGSCPKCNAQHIRNTCNYMYVRDVIQPIITNKFPVITEVTSLYTFQPDFEQVVMRLGGTVRYVNIDNKASLHHVERFMLDLHPNVDGFGKSMSLKLPGDDVYKYNDRVTCKMIFDKYTISWHVAHNTYFMSTYNKQFYQGVDAIVENDEKLPDGVSLVKVDDRLTTLGRYFLTVDNACFFNKYNYKSVSFDNNTN